jgi:hypothetical protein
MKFDDRGVSNRDEKLRVIGHLVGRKISSAKDLTTGEISLTLDVVNDDEAWTELLEELAQTEEPAAPTAGDAPEVAPHPPPAPSEHVTADEVSVVGPPAGEPARFDSGPRGWVAQTWTDFLRDRGVKTSVVIREAQRLAGERGTPAPTSVAELVGSGLEEALVGFIEDQHGRN